MFPFVPASVSVHALPVKEILNGIAVLYHQSYPGLRALTVCVIGLYALMIGVFGVLLQAQGNVVISRLSQRLEVTITPEAVLPTIVETVAVALKLPYVAILLKDEQAYVVAASFGQPCEDLLILPLVYQVDTIDQLRLAPRVPGEAFSAADKRYVRTRSRAGGTCVVEDVVPSGTRVYASFPLERSDAG